MFYVYLIQSIQFTDIKYVGFTNHLKQRLETHNSGGSIHTKKYRPWKLGSVEFSKYKIKQRIGNSKLLIAIKGGPAAVPEPDEGCISFKFKIFICEKLFLDKKLENVK